MIKTYHTVSLIRAIHRLLRLPLLGVLVVSATLHGQTTGENVNTLLKVSMDHAPILRNKKAIYTLDLTFNRCPERFWIFYDLPKRQLVIDTYGEFLNLEPRLHTFHQNQFRGISIVNQSTSMSLSGMQSRISIGADAGWHFEASCVDATTLRIYSWKYMETARIRTKQKTGPLAYILTGAGALVAAFVLVIVVGNAVQ